MAPESFDVDTIRRHNKRDDLWIIIDNKVYDVTEFVNDHPGGSEMFLIYAGEDASEAFKHVGHDKNEKVKALMVNYYIGEVKLSESESNVSDSTRDESMIAPKLFDYATIKKHNKRDDLWVIIDNKVYDVTEFVNDHPGGSEMFLIYAGEDATQGFEHVGHDKNEKVKTLMKDYYIGNVAPVEDDTTDEETEVKQQEKTAEPSNPKDDAVK